MSAREQQTTGDSGDSTNVSQQLESLKSLALNLAEEPENEQLLGSLVEEALKATSPLSKSFEHQYNLLKINGLAGSAFMNVAILGQEFLTKNLIGDSIQLLESSLKFAPDNKKIRGSIYSSLASAHFSASNLDSALKFMNEDLRIQSELGDINGQCRVLRNLAHLHFKMGKLAESINTHRRLIDLAMREKQFKHVCYTLSALGHVHSESNNLNAALTSHDRSLGLMRELAEPLYNQFMELMAIGHIYSLLDDFKAAQEKYEEAEEMVTVSEHQGDKLYPQSGQANMSKEQIFFAKIMLHFNRALIALKTSAYSEARKFYDQILMLANGANKRLDDEARAKLEMRAYLGLAHTCRLEKKPGESRDWIVKHLNLAHDLTSKSQALTNLAMSHQHSKDYERALELFEENHKLVESDCDKSRERSHLLALSHSYMGSMNQLLASNGHSAALALARHHYQKSLEIFNQLEACEEQRKSIEMNLATLADIVHFVSDAADSNGTNQPDPTDGQTATTSTSCHQDNANATTTSKPNSTRTSTSLSNNTSNSNSTHDINHNHITSS